MVSQIAFIEFQVGNLDRLPLSYNASHWNAYVVEADHRSALPSLLVGFRQRAVERSVAKDISVSQPKRPIARLGQPRRIRQHGLEHRLEIPWRSADDLQHLRSRRLLLQRLAQILRALPQLIKQARVLDGDDRLRGKIRDQFDLLVREWPDLLPVNDDSADQNFVFDHWHIEGGSRATEPCRRPRNSLSSFVGGVAYLFGPHHTIERASRQR